MKRFISAALAALMFTGLLVEVVSVLLASWLDMKELAPDYAFTLTVMGGFLLLLPLLVTIYPFLRYALSAPITSLRSVNISGRSIVSRSIFLMMQYILTFSLIVLSLFAIKQLHGMLHADLGFRTKDIMQCTFLNYNSSMDFNEMWKQNSQRAAQIVEKLESTGMILALVTRTAYKGGVGIVIGSEGHGVSRIVAEKCDFLISIPMKGEINSLNASVAAGVIMYEALRQRG